MPEPFLAEQYGSLQRQSLTLRFGMWVFLASELLLFAGFFTLYAAYRAMYGQDFVHALEHNTLAYGTVNTFVLLTSSLTVALSLGAARRDHMRVAAALLAISALLGVAFVAIKLAEYRVHIDEGALPGPYYRFAEAPGVGGARFFTMYWITTAAHAVHVLIGICVLAFTAWRTTRHAYLADYHPKLEMATLYWHFVDVMWIFIWPIFYLA